jgi:AraC-like DNA-binding protein
MVDSGACEERGIEMTLVMLKSGAVLHKASPTEVSSYVQRHIGEHRLELQGRRGEATLHHKRFGSVGLSQISYGSRVLVANAHGMPKTYHLQIVMEGSCEIRYPNRKTYSVKSGEAALINPLDPLCMEYSDDCVKLIVDFSPVLAKRAYGVQTGHAPAGELRFDAEPVGIPEGSAFRKILELIFLEADSSAKKNDAVCDALGLLMVAKAMEIVSCSVAASYEDDEFFGLIDGFIDTHIQQDIDVTEVARLSNVSVRTLYYRFKSVKGQSPQAYIKTRRLGALRKHIQTAPNHARNVTEVALQYGFTHLGRFASEYKELFGEFPSETLRRRRTFRN